MHLIQDKQKSPHTFIIPMFLQSGLYNYIIEYKGQFYFHKALVFFRKEQISLKIYDDIIVETEKFNKNISVFAEWEDDSAPKIQSCLNHDFKYIKFKQLDMKESTLEECKKVITNKFDKFKFVYMALLSESE